jgi:hypothetical protein
VPLELELEHIGAAIQECGDVAGWKHLQISSAAFRWFTGHGVIRAHYAWVLLVSWAWI